MPITHFKRYQALQMLAGLVFVLLGIACLPTKAGVPLSPKIQGFLSENKLYEKQKACSTIRCFFPAGCRVCTDVAGRYAERVAEPTAFSYETSIQKSTLDSDVGSIDLPDMSQSLKQGRM